MRRSRYPGLIDDLSALLESARHVSARAVNAVMTATYWEIGRRIVEYEQAGAKRAEYGAQLLARLSEDLTERFGRGFSADNLETMRRFYGAFARAGISEAVSRNFASPESRRVGIGVPRIRSTVSSKSETPSRKIAIQDLAGVFPLSWSH